MFDYIIVTTSVLMLRLRLTKISIDYIYDKSISPLTLHIYKKVVTVVGLFPQDIVVVNRIKILT